MAERSLLDAAGAMGGRIVAGPGDGSYRGAVLDSRRLEGGELFFALPGAQVDGHDFVADAARGGAAGIVIHRPDAAPPTDADSTSTWILVDDTYAALHALTRAVRRQTPEHLVAITGSAGKTTTKELLATLLGRQARVARSRGNFNNTYGFPISLLGIPADTEWMVAEMGMSTPGELRQVSLLGRPDIAVYTNIRPVHLENFQSLRHIADAKAELLAGVADGGTMVANADDAEVLRIAESFRRERGGRIVTYATQGAADVTASNPKPLANGVWRVGSRFELHAYGARRTVELPLHGLYNIENFLAAAACTLRVGLDRGFAIDPVLDEIVAAAAELRPSAMRGEVHRTTHGPTLIDDSYNSNPDAAARALESARMLPATRRVAILGDMLELGPKAPDFHRRVGKRAAELGFDLVIAVGRLSRHLEPGVTEAGGQAVWLEDADAVVQWLGTEPRLAGRPLGRGDLMLIKGSRGVGLDRVVQALLERYDAPTEKPVQAGGEA